MPLISVIVPIYKVEPYLRQCVDSVLNQTHTDLEVILVDDGSPDGCGAICDEYAAKDARVKVIHKENGGLSDARNAGLNVMRGAYVSFVDSDDWLELTALESLYAAMERTQADMVIGGNDRIEDRTGRLLSAPSAPDESRIMDKHSAMKQALTQGCAAWARLYKAKVHTGICFPVGEINEDEAIVLRLLERCDRVTEINEVVYHYRCRPESITTTSFSAKKLVWVKHCRENLTFVQKKYPELELDAIARYRESLLWSLAEMACTEGLDAEVAQTLLDLKRNKHLLITPPYAYRTDKIRMFLLLNLPFFVFRWITKKRREYLEV